MTNYGLAKYKHFGNALTSTGVDVSIALAVTLVVLLLTFRLEYLIGRGNLNRKVSAFRFRVMKEEGENLLLKVEAFVQTLKLSKATQLSGRSWNAANKATWPTKNLLKQLRIECEASSPNWQEYKAVQLSLDALRKAIDAVARKASTTNLFEGAEDLGDCVMWVAELKIGWVWHDVKILGQSPQPDELFGPVW